MTEEGAARLKRALENTADGKRMYPVVMENPVLVKLDDARKTWFERLCHANRGLLVR